MSGENKSKATLSLKISPVTLVLEIRDKFKCCGELLIHFLLCLLVTNILLSSHHPPPAPPLLSKVRPSHISLRFLWRSTSSPVSPDEEERSGVEWMLQMFKPRSWSFVRTGAQPWSSCVGVRWLRIRCCTESRSVRRSHWTWRREMLLTGMGWMGRRHQAGTIPALQSPPRPVQTTLGDPAW